MRRPPPTPKTNNRLIHKVGTMAGWFYDVGTKTLGWLGRLPAIAAIAVRVQKRPRVLAAELFVALSLTVSFFFLIKPSVRPGTNGDALSNGVFSYLVHHMPPQAKDMVPPSWRMRLAGPITSGWLMDAMHQKEILGPRFENIFAFYHSFWLFLLFLALIYFRRDALLIMLGTMSGLMYYLSDPVRPQFFVWDIANMFFFTLACLMFLRGRMWSVLLCAYIGALFKETTLCCAILVLLGEGWPWRKRIPAFLGTVAVTFATYKILMAAYGMTGRVFAMNQAVTTQDLIWHSVMPSNLHAFFSFMPRHVLFANAGGLLLMLLIPWGNRREVALKIVVFTYIIGEFFWGIITELRIWYEVLPLGWIVVSTGWFTPGAEIKSDDRSAWESRRVFVGSYWLVLGSLVAAAAALCLVTKPTLQVAEEKDPAHMSTTALLLAAPRGNVEAQYYLGLAYVNGLGIEKSTDEAIHWFQKAATNNHAPSQNALGSLLSKSGDYQHANYWFKAAAAKGEPTAEYNLGVAYERGLGVPKDNAAAFHWIHESALNNYHDSIVEVAYMYKLGGGTDIDDTAAYQWLKIAWLQGDQRTESDLKEWGETMTPDQIAVAEKFAKEFREKHP